MSFYNSKDLEHFCQNVLVKLGVPSEHAYIVTDSLITANLEGVDSHGISRLAIYGKRLKDKRINPKPNIKIDKKGTSVLLVNGDNGLGQVASFYAIQRGIELVKKTGVCAIGIRQSNHFGTASYYMQYACKHQVAAIGFTNSPPGIAPWGGKKPFFGTNPIAFGFPTKDGASVIIDLSTSVVARGKIILAAKQNECIPNGWAINEDGIETNDPKEALNGAVLPFGGAKGSALALAVEILTGVLSGATYGPYVNNIYSDDSNNPANVGHFFVLLDVAKFMPVDDFSHHLQELLNDMKNIPTISGVSEIRYPGERRKRERDKRLKIGIPLSEEVVKELKLLGQSLNLAFPKKRVKGKGQGKGSREPEP
ncbi:Ldh family oxidoreductase [Fervidibacillus albus]|uniref:Ldh family oxidoreductase n=1 Tax=Fervidibacillus albus TaxID=2980026 RepID=A0A9E8LSX6_9BACI|nr:Ldh family oxidoreductase [Fervidibacillus albus]WAA09008.1 Ldh family oxidoreductase [Fervidibacillus albus]